MQIFFFWQADFSISNLCKTIFWHVLADFILLYIRFGDALMVIIEENRIGDLSSKSCTKLFAFNLEKAWIHLLYTGKKKNNADV